MLTNLLVWVRWVSVHALQNPSSEVVDTIEGIREATSAWNVPWNCSYNLTGNNEGTTAVSLADTLTGHSESTNLVIEHKLSVVDCVSRSAILVGQSCCLQPLQVVGSWSSSNSGTSPSWHDCVKSTTGVGCCKWNSLNIGCHCNGSLGTNSSHAIKSFRYQKRTIINATFDLLIGDPCWVVTFMGVKFSTLVIDSSSVQQNTSDNNANGCLSTVHDAIFKLSL